MSLAALACTKCPIDLYAGWLVFGHCLGLPLMRLTVLGAAHGARLARRAVVSSWSTTVSACW